MPHWYIGIIVPIAVGGIIPGLLSFLLPYGVGIWIGFCKDLFGCQYAMKEANHDELEKAVDKEGNKIMIGDTV
jgi:hypothetical protein